MSLDAVVQRGTSIARVANTRCPSMYRRVCVERAFAAERKRYPPRASQRVFTTRRCQSAALLGVHSQPHRWLKLVISVYYSSNTSLIEREYDDTCDSCCACWFTVVFFLLFFYAHNNDTIVSKKEEGKQAHERRRYSLHAFCLLFSNHRHRLLGTYHLAFASSVSNLLGFFPGSSFFEDDDEEAERLLLLLNVHEKYTVAAKNARTTAFPSIAPGGFRKLIASRPSLKAIFCTRKRQKCDASDTKRYKDVLLLRLL